MVRNNDHIGRIHTQHVGFKSSSFDVSLISAIVGAIHNLAMSGFFISKDVFMRVCLSTV